MTFPNQFLSDFDMDSWFDTPTASVAPSPKVASLAHAPSSSLSSMPPYNYAHVSSPSIFHRSLQRSGGGSASSPSTTNAQQLSNNGKSKEIDIMDQKQQAFNPSLYDLSNIPPSTDPLFSLGGFTAGLMGSTPTQGASSSSATLGMGMGMPSASMMPTASNSANITGGIAGGLGAGLGAMGSGLNAISGMGMSMGMGGLPMLGPVPPGSNAVGSNLSGLYSSSGFDMIGVLARIVARPNPQINIGPIDMSCSFLVVDARKYDFPIVYASPTFEKLTAYSSTEIVGRNCRFLQAPDGHVALGSRRKYTDNSAVYHVKTHMLQGKECQASIINYRKGGQPFINLITIIPITWDSDEIAYFVGLQVDLVEQPNAILEKMKDGTYVVNYQLMNMPAYIPGALVNEPVDDYFRDIPTSTPFPASPEVFDLIGGNSDNDISKRLWNRMLLEHSDDFIHVLSLKGIFLYCSPSSQKLLEYDHTELVGLSLSHICHPSDIVPVMRELKESSNGVDTVNLVYRIKRKNSGFMWIECQGKLHLEQGKGRKCVILSGRERPVYRLIWKEVMNAALTEGNASGLLSDTEFWSKVSCDGLYLYTTSTCTNVLGFVQEEIVGMSLYQLVRSDRTTDVTRALSQAKDGKTVNMRHHMQNKKGQHVEVASTFYPGDVAHGIGKPSFVVIQTRECGENIGASGNSSNSSRDGSVRAGSASPSYGSSGSESGSATPPPGRLGLLTAEYSGEENIFEELETIRSTSWQYELHQMRLTNKKLREELEALMNSKRKKKKRSQPSGTKICAHCQRKDSPEWRKGPNGPKELCNACGLRYAKTLGSGGSGSSADASSA